MALYARFQPEKGLSTGRVQVSTNQWESEERARMGWNSRAAEESEGGGRKT